MTVKRLEGILGAPGPTLEGGFLLPQGCDAIWHHPLSDLVSPTRYLQVERYCIAGRMGFSNLGDLSPGKGHSPHLGA